MNINQTFTVKVETRRTDGCGNTNEPKTPGDIRRAIEGLAEVTTVEVTEENLREKIAAVFRRYCECDDIGNRNPQFDDTYTAQEAMDEIHLIIGNFYAKQPKEG